MRLKRLMRGARRIKTANDNTPQPGARRSAPKIQPIPHQNKPVYLKPKTVAKKHQTHFAGWMTLALITTMIAGAIFFGVNQISGLILLSFSALIALGFALQMDEDGKWRMKELSTLALIISGGLGLFGGASYLGSPPTIIASLAIGSSSCLGLFVWLKSRMALMASLFGSYIWFALLLVGTLSADLVIASPVYATLPLLCLAQIWAAMHIRSGRALILASLISIAWIAMLGYQSALSAPALGSALFMLGAAQHRLGKAAEDRRAFGAGWHNVIGWSVAILGAMILQRVWLNPDVELLRNAASEPLPMLWHWVVIGSAIAILLSSFAKWNTGKLGLLGVMLISAISAILPISAYRPDWIEAIFANIQGVKASPGFGLMIGTAILVVAVSMIATGLKRDKLGFILLGVSVFGLQAFMMFQPGLMNTDLAVVTFLSLITALAIGGLIAGRSLNAASAAR